jgi:hypothetical protein
VHSWLACTASRSRATAACPTARLVDEAIRAELTGYAPDVTGISCRADGDDQIFARAVTDLGGTLEAVIPARNSP